MRRDLFGDREKFIYGNTCASKIDFIPNRKKLLGNTEVVLDTNKLDPQTTRTDFPILPSLPVQTAAIEEVLHRNLNWCELLPKIRNLWGCSQNEMAQILGLSEKTIFNIEKSNTKPNTFTREKLFFIKEMTDFLLAVLGRKYAIRALLNSELPALGMLSPKEYLTGDIDSDEAIQEVLGLFKRMYR